MANFRPLPLCRHVGPAEAALLLLPWLTACSGTPSPVTYPLRDVSTTWEYRGGEGRFVQQGTGESCDPRALLARGKRSAEEGDLYGAQGALQAIRRSGVDAALKEEALVEEARAWIRAKQRLDAHAAYVEFLERYPRSSRFSAAIQEAFQNAFRLAEEEGQAGVLAVRDLLNRFPRETMSAEYAFQLGEHFFRQESYDAAETEFESVRREYARTPWAEAALYRIGLCGRRRFKGLSYDPRPLAQARRAFEKFLVEYPTSSLADDVRRALKDVRELQAQKTLAIAAYYGARHRWTAARTLYAFVVQDFPDSAAAAEAREALGKLPPPDAPPATEPGGGKKPAS
jgi:outer membrane assembly lipoprotein YfiO